MSYINKKTKIFMQHPKVSTACVRSEARLKNYSSSIDVRAWCDIVEERRQHILQYVAKNKEGMCMDKNFPLECLFDAMLACKNCEMKQLLKRINRYKKLLHIYSQINLAPDQQNKLNELKSGLMKAHKELKSIDCNQQQQVNESFFVEKKDSKGDGAYSGPGGLKSGRQSSIKKSVTIREDKESEPGKASGKGSEVKGGSGATYKAGIDLELKDETQSGTYKAGVDLELKDETQPGGYKARVDLAVKDGSQDGTYKARLDLDVKDETQAKSYKAGIDMELKDEAQTGTYKAGIDVELKDETQTESYKARIDLELKDQPQDGTYKARLDLEVKGKAEAFGTYQSGYDIGTMGRISKTDDKQQAQEPSTSKKTELADIALQYPDQHPKYFANKCKGKCATIICQVRERCVLQAAAAGGVVALPEEKKPEAAKDDPEIVQRKCATIVRQARGRCATQPDTVGGVVLLPGKQEPKAAEQEKDRNRSRSLSIRRDSKITERRCTSLARQVQGRCACLAATSGGVVPLPAKTVPLKDDNLIPQGYSPGTTNARTCRGPCSKNRKKKEKHIKECNHQLHGQYIHHKPLKASEGKETVKLFGGDGTKELIVPSRDPVDVPAILPQAEYERLKKQAHVVTLKEKMAMLDEANKIKEKEQLESNMRKQALTKAQLEQRAVPGSKLDSVESEAAAKNLYLLKRSQDLILEQDDRVKRANGVILATKCRAIRNAQISEKKLLEKQWQDENKRLDMMMEQQRQKTIEIEEKKRQENQRKIHVYVTEVKQQIKENELERLLEAERVEEESRMLNKALIALQKEEQQKQKEKLDRQLKMREEFKKSNSEAAHFRNLKLEEQRISDLRIQQFMKEKAEREEARERELALAAAAKEAEIARLRAAQEKSADYQAAMDEMNALRMQEEKEKEWRENEKAAAKKKKELLDDLRAARAQQIGDIRKAQAQSLAREEEDFMKVARVQRELFEKDIEEKRKKKELTAKHQKELLMQINEKERERINKKRENFEDGKAQRLEIEINDRKIEDYLRDKVNGLKSNNVPVSYIKDIERQLKLS